MDMDSMKRMMLVLVIATAVFALGLYMGWFRLASESADGKSDITLTVDKDKIEQDKDKTLASVRDLGQRTNDKLAATTQPEASSSPP